MIFVIDTSSLKILVTHFYQERFPSLWEKVNKMIEEQGLISVREVKNEIEDYGTHDILKDWAKDNKSFFHNTTNEEAQFMRRIFEVKHFQNNIAYRNRKRGKPIADPMVIAKAYTHSGAVVTEEKHTPNSAKIPNICEHFQIECINLEKFMEYHDWTF